MSIVPFLRPDLDQSNERPPLLISGKLANAKPGDAYEGRLQIHNQIGACSILSVTGDALPPGSQVYVDGDEIVVAWPAYVEAAAPITNPGFEDGMAGWKGGAGWDTTTNNPITGTRSAVYYNAPGSSILSSQSRYPVNTGVPITATAAIRQGASSAGNAGAGVRLEWRDADGNLRRFKDGNMVMSASNNAVKPSSVTDYPQPGDELVNIACHGLRKRQNREVWVDTLAWDHTVAAAGVNEDGQFCITITIRDSAWRTAQWSGCIRISGGASKIIWISSNSVAFADWYTGDLSGFALNAGVAPAFIPRGIVTNLSGVLFVTTQGPNAVVYKSDPNASWNTATKPAGGRTMCMAETENYYWIAEYNIPLLRSPKTGVAFTAAGGNVRGGVAAANGVVLIGGPARISEDEGATWFTAMPGGYGTQYCALASSEHLFSMDGSQYSTLRRWTGGTSWVAVPGITMTWPAEDPNWAYTDDGKVMYVASGNVYLSTNAGVSFALVGPHGLTVDNDGRRLVHAAGTWYLYANDGIVYASVNDGTTWTAVSSAITGSGKTIGASPF